MTKGDFLKATADASMDAEMLIRGPYPLPFCVATVDAIDVADGYGEPGQSHLIYIDTGPPWEGNSK